MNNYIKKIIITLLLINITVAFSQKKDNDIYIYVDSNNFFNNGNGFSAFFNLNSDEKTFLFDVFHFEIINNKPFKKRKITDLGKVFKMTDFKYHIPKVLFKDINSCTINLRFSLLSENNNLFLVTKIPVKDEEFMSWKVIYKGTYKSNSIFTQMGKGPFRSNKR